MSVKEQILDALYNNKNIETFNASTIEDWVLAYMFCRINNRQLCYPFKEAIFTEAIRDVPYESSWYSNRTLTFDCDNRDALTIGYGLDKTFDYVNVSISDESKIIFKDCVERYGLSLLPNIRAMCRKLNIELSHDFHKNTILRYHLGNTKSANNQ